IQKRTKKAGVASRFFRCCSALLIRKRRELIDELLQDRSDREKCLLRCSRHTTSGACRDDRKRRRRYGATALRIERDASRRADDTKRRNAMRALIGLHR